MPPIEFPSKSGGKYGEGCVVCGFERHPDDPYGNPLVWIDHYPSGLSLCWQSPNGPAEWDWEPDHTNAEVIVAAKPTEQHDPLHFCSAKCLRAFLNAAVDQLEANIAVAAAEFDSDLKRVERERSGG